MAASSEFVQMMRNPSGPLRLLCHHSICKECLPKHVKNYPDAFPEGSSKFVCPLCSSDESLPKDLYLMCLIEDIPPKDEDCGMRNMMWCETCEGVVYSLDGCEEHEVTEFPETIEKTEAEIKKTIEESFKNLNLTEENSFDHADEVAIDMNISTLQEFFDKVKCLVENKIDFLERSLDVKSDTTEKIDNLYAELNNLKVELQENRNCSKPISCRFCNEGEDFFLLKQKELKQEKLTDILRFLKELNSSQYND